MSKTLIPQDVIAHKEKMLQQLDDLLDNLIHDTGPLKEKHLKKANLIEYWLESYIGYIQREESFNPKHLKRYERGDIIKVNFGFNVGSEYGGLHYAIVLDKANPINSSVITVVPLTSYEEGDEIHPDDIFLGKELYSKLTLKVKGLKQKVSAEQQEKMQLESSLNALLDFLEPYLNETAATKEENTPQQLPMSQMERYLQVIEQMESLNVHQTNIAKQQKLLNKAAQEIAKMKDGSIALPNQITTISKQRIYDPKSSYDVLSGVKLSPEGLDKLSDGIKKLFFL